MENTHFGTLKQSEKERGSGGSGMQVKHNANDQVVSHHVVLGRKLSNFFPGRLTRSNCAMEASVVQKPHLWKATGIFTTPTWCTVCDEFFWASAFVCESKCTSFSTEEKPVGYWRMENVEVWQLRAFLEQILLLPEWATDLYTQAIYVLTRS
jgi:hypothetical protein